MKGNVSYCKVTQQACIDTASIENEYMKNVDNICPPPCDELSYQLVVSRHQWPSAAGTDYLKKKFGLKNESTTETIRESTVKVVVYFRDFNMETISEKPMYDLFKFLSEIGGHLGLWIGLSLLAVMELVEIVFDLAYQAFQHV